MWTIDPKIPMGLWWALALAALAAVSWYAIRRDWSVSIPRRCLLTLLLAICVMGPLVIALNPTYIETIPPPAGQPLLSILVDGTMSMQTQDIGESQRQSRWSRAVELADQVQVKQSRVELRRQAISNTLKPMPIQDDVASKSATDAEHWPQEHWPQEHWPQGHRTDLATAVRQTIRSGSPLGHAVLLISDGAHNVGSVDSVLQAAREANALATPIYTLTLGTSVGMKNMSLTAKSPRMLAFPDSPISIRVNIGHNGLTGQKTRLSLLRDDKSIQTQDVTLTSDPVQEVRFTLEKGSTTSIERFRVVATEVPGEVTTADNETSVLVQRLTAPIGVLMLEGKPYWDSKFLSRNLAGDPVVDLTAIVQLSPQRFLKRKLKSAGRDFGDVPIGTPVLASTNLDSNADEQTSASSDDWSIEKGLASPLESMQLLESYRVVMLGRDSDAFLTAAAIENLRIWISQSGGCLLCARGAPTDQVAAKLSEILPVRWVAGNETHFRTKLSNYGFDSSVFDPLLSDGNDPLGSLPSLTTGATPKTRAGLPQVLVESAAGQDGGTIPVVTYQPYGRGQTVVVEGAGMWRWAFLPPQHAAKDSIYPTLWQSMIQWIISQQDIMPGQEIAIRSDRANFLSGDQATASVVVRNPDLWQLENGQLDLAVMFQSSQQPLPTRLSLVPSGADRGLYRVDLGNLEVGFYSANVVHGDKDEVLAATAFEVRDPWFESLEVDARDDIMRQIARLSGGEVLQPDEIAGLVERYAKRIAKNQHTEVRRNSLWDKPSVLLLILACWIGTWIVRRKNGLI